MGRGTDHSQLIGREGHIDAGEGNSRYDEANSDSLMQKMVTRFKAVLFRVKISTFNAIFDYILYIFLWPCAKFCRCFNGPYDRVHVL